MADTDYIFHISPYDTEKLLPQVSRALEKRTEMVSRERFPGLWKHTDRFRSMARGRKRSRLRTRGMSALCLAAGIFLAVPGLMEPRELFVPLLVGAAAMGAGIIGLWQSRARKKNPFDRAAKILLEGKDKSSAEQAASVSFSEEGMTVRRAAARRNLCHIESLNAPSKRRIVFFSSLAAVSCCCRKWT